MNNILVLLFLCWYCACIYDDNKQIYNVHCGIVNTVRVLGCMWSLNLCWWYEQYFVLLFLCWYFACIYDDDKQILYTIVAYST
jgi:hypothetical protein